MTKDAAILKNAWQSAAQELISLAHNGKTVVFLTLGDALLYSTWGYVLAEIKSLAPNIPVQSVPGITAMAACAAEAEKPLAEGSSPLIIWPGEPPKSMPLHSAGTFVFMKASRHLKTIENLAEQNNKECVAVRNCCLPNQGITRNLSSWENDTEYFTTVLCFPSKKENSR
jgi:precorrin-2/cobalt-factor-2 C20-methyltransferase